MGVKWGLTVILICIFLKVIQHMERYSTSFCHKGGVICISEVIDISAIVIPACASSSPAFLMMYSAQKLNKQGDNIALMYSFSYLEPVCCSMSSSNCCFLTCIQVYQDAGQVVWYSHLLKNFPQFILIHTVKGFGVVNETEVDVFLKFPCFLYHPANVANLILFFFKPSLDIWKFLVHILLKPSMQDFKHDLTSMGYSAIVQWSAQSLVRPFFGIGMSIDLFQSCGHCWVFQFADI